MTVATTETKIWLALKSRVAEMALDMGLDVAYPKETHDPTSTGGIPDPYLICDFLPNINARMSMGSGEEHNRQGILSISVMRPLVSSVDVDIQIAGTVASWFADDLKLTFEGLQTKITKAPDIAKGYRDGQYFRTPVSIQWRTFG